MGWQEELRRLDAELADGHITHNQHRRLRDELLASASGGAMPSPRASPLQRREQAGASVWRSTNPGSESRPAEERPAAASAPESAPALTPTEPPTRHRYPAWALLESGRPTTAPSPADHRRTESLPHPLLDQPTQQLRPVPAVPPLVPLRGRVPLQAVPARTPATPQRQKPTWLFISLGVLLVLGLIIAGAWWLGSFTDGAVGGEETRNAAGAPTIEPALEDRLPVLPGEQNSANSTMSVERGLELKLYSAEDAAVMKTSGAEDVVYRNSTTGADGTDTFTILIIRTNGPEQAARITTQMRNSLTNLGAVPVAPVETAALGVPLTVSSAAGRLAATWYVSGTNAVGVATSQAPGDDKQELRLRFDRTLGAVDEVLPRG
jgi:hypothetical protein